MNAVVSSVELLLLLINIKKSLAQAAAAREVIFTSDTSGNTQFAVRVKIFPYPAGVYALWVMVAVRFDGT